MIVITGFTNSKQFQNTYFMWHVADFNIQDFDFVINFLNPRVTESGKLLQGIHSFRISRNTKFPIFESTFYLLNLILATTLGDSFISALPVDPRHTP